MNSRYLIPSSLLVATACTCLAAVQAGPTTMIGNLGEYPESIDIGPVHTPGDGIYFGSSFRTGSEACYTLDSIAVERYGFNPAAPLHVQLYQQNSAGKWALVAELGEPLPAATPTRYPNLTTFVSYAPATEVILEPSSTYLVGVGQPLGSPPMASLVFTPSANYVAAPGWTLASDYSGVDSGYGVNWRIRDTALHLKFQVDATYLRPANLPPDVSQAQASVTTLWPPNGKLVPFQVLGVTDPNGDPVRVTITSIVQDEPVGERSASGAKGNRKSAEDSFDALFLWDDFALVRAERYGYGNGRVYSISFVASDGKGGESEGVVFISVPHDCGTAATDDGPALGYYLSFGE